MSDDGPSGQDGGPAITDGSAEGGPPPLACLTGATYNIPYTGSSCTEDSSCALTVGALEGIVGVQVAFDPVAGWVVEFTSWPDGLGQRPVPTPFSNDTTPTTVEAFGNTALCGTSMESVGMESAGVFVFSIDCATGVATFSGDCGIVNPPVCPANETCGELGMFFGDSVSGSVPIISSADAGAPDGSPGGAGDAKSGPDATGPEAEDASGEDAADATIADASGDAVPSQGDGGDAGAAPTLLEGVVAISGGTPAGASCALLSDGTVDCWAGLVGPMGAGQGAVGDGTADSTMTPMPVFGLRGATSVAVGPNFACAVLSDTTVACWGDDGAFELGAPAPVGCSLSAEGLRPMSSIGAEPCSTGPLAVATLSDAVALAAGWDHVCALKSDGAVACWGDGQQGALGSGATGLAQTPVAVTGLPGIASLTAGMDFTCGLTSAGAVWCWGTNDSGQLGNGSTAASFVPAVVPGLSGVRAIAAGFDHACALLSGGTVACWGSNANGQLGLGTTAGPQTCSGAACATAPVVVPGLVGAASIAAGATESCAGLADGSITCWGEAYGSASPVPVPALQGVAALSMSKGGVRSACALTIAGTVACWEDPTSVTPVPAPAPVVTNAARVTLGGGVCPTLLDGTVACLGGGVGGFSRAPVPVAGFPAAVVDVAQGQSHACALLSDGTVACWGDDSQGQLGDGSSTSTSTTTPGVVPGVSGMTAIAAGAFHTCAVRSDGSVTCWGGNSASQLGVGKSGGSSPPVQLPSLSDVVNIAAGGFDTCALLTNGTAACWGGGAPLASAVPAPVVTLSGAVAITVGGSSDLSESHACALLANGAVSCWGSNANGELGTGDNTNHLTPVAVPGISGALAVAAGAQHTCAILSNGSLACWGSNASGQLGNGSLTTSKSPVPVPVLAGVTRIGAGPNDTCAVLGNGSLQCWGAFGGSIGGGIADTVVLPLAVSLVDHP